MNNLKYFKQYILPVKWLFLLAAVLMIFESLFLLSMVGLQQLLIDDVLLAKQYDKVLGIILLFAFVFIAYALLFTFAPHAMHITTAKIQKRLSQQFMDYMYKIPTAILQKERTATYVHHITEDIYKVSDMIGQQMPRGIQQIFSALFLIVIIGIASPPMLIFCLVITILYVFLSRVFTKRIRKAAREVQEAKSQLLVHLEEGISSTREVIAYHRLKWEEKLYRSIFGNYFEKVMKEGKLENLQMISSEPLNWGVRLLILGYGGYLVLQDQLSIGMFVIMFQFGAQFVQFIQGFFNFVMQMSVNNASVDRLRNVMEKDRWEDGVEELQNPIHEIHFNNVSFSYEENHSKVLHDLHFQFPIGKKIAIVGLSGGGKSTISQLLIRFFEPVSGEIIVNGMPLHKWKRSDWIDRVGIVFQEPYLFPDTIRNNLCLGMEDVPESKMIESCQAAQIHEYIMSLPEQYDTGIGDRGITLSGGQRQRVAIARTLMRDPEILILDEATSALDLTTERELQETIDQLRRGKTTIIIAHRLSTVKNADVILVMDKGQIVERGTHEELLENGSVYRQLVYHQQSESA
ncbi:ABC transporter ATP-binding protein [Chengkuizengella axinellae]|uniref:ABC transporter ATP-binding protein n=1 Tax=Chengkuizengella axinellae TaxID=3064388 RepID=A0ABT9IWJ5_9BACL|nr:ABC transporter ATP-binding protein [Chengkuizengella sp. 2205SS18-9]MDP5273726.1 ABC transporter ATP-binding protein [Chengkuizengella sp. 2205SS18-9]